MTRGGLTLLATIVLAIAVPVGANATYSLFDYDSAVDALVAVDPTIRPEANDPGRDFVVGGYHGFENNNDGISAHSDALLGFDPQGHVSDTRPGLLFGMIPSTFQGRFKVTCLAVVGNEAALGLKPMDSSSNDQPTEVVLAVRDNGRGVPDQYAFYDLPAAACPTAIPDAILTIESGNILVHDALPIP
jgi:hypothetical protein